MCSISFDIDLNKPLLSYWSGSLHIYASALGRTSISGQKRTLAAAQ